VTLGTHLHFWRSWTGPYFLRLAQMEPLPRVPYWGSGGTSSRAGFAYVAVAWQIAAEAIVPLNREAGEGVGFRAQLLFFLDDLLPSVFGRPLLSDQPHRSLIAWH
jgi:hypothetical protein